MAAALLSKMGFNWKHRMVDMESLKGRETFLFLSPDEGWVYLQERGRKIYARLTKEQFIDILKGFLA